MVKNINFQHELPIYCTAVLFLLREVFPRLPQYAASLLLFKKLNQKIDVYISI